MLEKLKLTNFRQHKNTTIEFVQGINTIVGENNSGKSTIPEAIEFALFGSKALRDDAKGYITDGEREGSAVIKLEVIGDAYTVGRNSKNAELKKNGILESQYKSNTSQEVVKLTGVNQTGYRLGHYVRQKELAAFSGMRPGKRHELIEKMLKVHAVDKAILRVKNEYSEVELNQKVLYASYTDIDGANNELDDLYLVKQMLIERGDKCQEQLDSIKDILETTRLANTTYINAKAKLVYNDKLLTTWEEDCTEASLASIELDKLLDERSKLDWSTYLDVKKVVDDLQKTEILYTKMSGIKSQLDCELLIPQAVIQPDLVDETEHTNLLAEVTAINKQITSLKCLEKEACCPTCLQALPDIAYVLQGLNNVYSRVNDKLTEARNTMLVAKQSYQVLKRQYDDYCIAKRFYDDSMTKKAKLLEEYIEVNFDKEFKDRVTKELEALQSVKEASIKF
jgi:hypothetical protein